jgi:ATP-dependent DNA helicase RecG
LVVTDEQHRFGAQQRATLSQKNTHAHLLVMSATPIPRSLALVLYGDLEISKIDEMPPGRQRVDTFAVDESYRERMNAFIEKNCAEGGQVYIVCPAVEERDAEIDELLLSEIGEQAPLERAPLKAAVQYAEELKAALPALSIGVVHGKMKSKEKEKIMQSFASGEVQVLVSTTVIEVGVNVPNASVMVIENAERFGLAQLHQLRGRVGRGSDEAWCFLMAEPNERLKFLSSTTDGFKIAQKDMEIRGPGDLFGTRQSGTIVVGVGTFAGDTQLLKTVHDEARALLKDAGSEDAQIVIRLAEAEYVQKFRDAALN